MKDFEGKIKIDPENKGPGINEAIDWGRFAVGDWAHSVVFGWEGGGKGSSFHV